MILTVCLVCLLCGCNKIADSETDTTDDTHSNQVVDTESESFSESETTARQETVSENSAKENQPVFVDIIDTNITDNDALNILEQIVLVADKYELSISYKFNQYYYSINGDKTYDSASTIKAVYCQYLMATDADFDERLVFDTEYDRSSSSGKLTVEHKGELFTVGELIKYTIVYSDNMAYRLLFDKYGYKGFNEYVKELGIPGLAFGSDHEFTRVTATDLTAGMWEVLQFSKKDNRLTDFLVDAEYKYQIASGTDYTVASKYGYQGGTKGFHDTAIVFANEPYVLTIMSNLDPSKNANATKPFGQITAFTDDLHEILCKK